MTTTKKTQSRPNKPRNLRTQTPAKADEPEKGATTPPPRSRYKKRLRTLPDVRVYLADLIHATRDGEVDSNLAGKIAFMINILRAVIADSELAQRIEKLEKEMEKRESA